MREESGGHSKCWLFKSLMLCNITPVQQAKFISGKNKRNCQTTDQTGDTIIKSTCIVITPVCVGSVPSADSPFCEWDVPTKKQRTHTPRKHKERHCRQLAEVPGNQIYKIPKWNHNRIPFHYVQKDPLPSFNSFYSRILVSTWMMNQANSYSDQICKINRLESSRISG